MTDKIQQAMRAAFEARFQDECNLDMIDDFHGEYQCQYVRNYWHAFNAALDCVVIELPADIDQFADDDPGWRAFSLFTNTALRSCRAAIESTSLGIKVK